MITILIILFVFGIIVSVYTTYTNVKRLKKMRNNWPVQHRLNEHGFLQYSVDGKLWTNIITYNDNFDYGNYKGPNIEYIHIDNNEMFNIWKHNLSSMQKCHEWNKKALDTYIKEVKKFLKTNN